MEAERQSLMGGRLANAQISEQGCFCSGECDFLKQTSPYKRIQEIVLLLFCCCCNGEALGAKDLP